MSSHNPYRQVIKLFDYLLRKSLCLSHTAQTRPTVKTHCKANFLSGKGKEEQLIHGRHKL